MKAENYFYDDYQEFDSEILKLKETLINSVKQEITDEIARLKTENAELRPLRKELETLKSQLRRELEEEKDKLRREKVTDILKRFEQRLYVVISHWGYATPKCNKCDENRNVVFYSPSGQRHTESCDCSKQREYKFYVEERVFYRLISDKYGERFYTQRDSQEEKSSAIYDAGSRLVERIVKAGEDVTKITMSWEGLHFESKDDCQMFCDFLYQKTKK